MFSGRPYRHHLAAVQPNRPAKSRIGKLFTKDIRTIAAHAALKRDPDAILGAQRQGDVVGAIGAKVAQSGSAGRGLLNLTTRPAILIKTRGHCDAALAGVAPGLSWLGVMLPYTPLQFLLFHEAANRPPGLGWLDRAQDLALVMTSANPGGEPLVVGNNEALLRLYGIADAFLMHDRDIVSRCDDSVARISSGGLQFIRRARGYTPRAIKLPISGP